MRQIRHTVDIEAPAEKVYVALTTEKGLSRWWSTRVRAATRVGGVVAFTFRGDFNPEMEITGLEPPRLLTWTCRGGHEPWHGSTFRFELEQRRDGTVLFFTLGYASEIDDEEYGRYTFNWGYYLDSLRLLCETGTDKPFTPAR